ncbi:hypothetical protein [Sphingobium fuliginis]|nr:hypothetical protein [Sphingobium fuliginis]
MDYERWAELPSLRQDFGKYGSLNDILDLGKSVGRRIKPIFVLYL